MPNALPSTTLAVLRPTPGRVTILEPRRHLPVEALDKGVEELSSDSVLARKNPVGCTIASIRSRSPAAIAVASG